jgi:dTDP-4-dehydrorhamnose 3,5-epimerase
MSQPYHPESARGLPWNDPAFRIEWPIPDPILSPKDRNHERFTDTRLANIAQQYDHSAGRR